MKLSGTNCNIPCLVRLLISLWVQKLFFIYFDPTIGSMQGIYSRALRGNASAEDAASFGNYVEPLASTGLILALQDQ